jgi:hypothetical protein
MERMLLFIFYCRVVIRDERVRHFFFVLVASRRRRRVLRPNRADRSSGRQDDPGQLDHALHLSIVFFDAQFFANSSNIFVLFYLFLYSPSTN